MTGVEVRCWPAPGKLDCERLENSNLAVLAGRRAFEEGLRWHCQDNELVGHGRRAVASRVTDI